MDETPVVKIARLRPEADEDIPLPHYMTPGAAGMDIAAAVASPVFLDVGEIALIPTGFAIELPVGLEAQIRPRSGLAIKHGIGIPNSPGTIDADYRGEVKVALINFSQTTYTIQRGERIAQMIIAPVYQATLQPVASLSASGRGDGGFGHTGR